MVGDKGLPRDDVGGARNALHGHEDEDEPDVELTNDGKGEHDAGNRQSRGPYQGEEPGAVVPVGEDSVERSEEGADEAQRAEDADHERRVGDGQHIPGKDDELSVLRP